MVEERVAAAGRLEVELRRALVEAGQHFYAAGMMAGSAGNLSARLDASRVLITPSGAAKGRMAEADLLVIDLDGRVLSGSGRPSSESAMHLAIYRQYSGAQSVLHAHPPVSTALAAAHRPIPVDTLPEALFALGQVATVPYIPAASPELGGAVAAALADADAALLLNHGVVVMGSSVEAARGKLETLEFLASVAVQTHLLGGAVALAASEVERLRAIWRKRRWEK